MDTAKAQLASLGLGEDDRTLCFLSHHKGSSGKDARLLKDLLVQSLGVSGDFVFLDSDEKHLDLNGLLSRVRSTYCVLLLLTKDTLLRPYVIGEIVCAIEADVPIVAVNIAGGGYNFEAASKFLSEVDFGAAMDREAPGSSAVLRKQNIDVQHAGQLLSERIPQIIAKSFNAMEDSDIVDAQVKVIIKSMFAAIAMKNTAVASHVHKGATAASSSKSGGPNGQAILDMIARKDSGGLLKALKKFGEVDESVAANVCSAFAKLADDDQEKDRLGTMGACEEILTVLKTWGQVEKSVAVNACLAIAKLSFKHEKNALLFISGCGEIVNIVHTWYKTDLEVTYRACSAMATMSAQNANQMRFGQFGACQTIHNVLVRWYQEDQEACVHACFTIGSLGLAMANKVQFGNMGTCELVVLVMQKWGFTDREVGQKACIAIGVLTNNNENRERFGVCGACEAVPELMRRWCDTDCPTMLQACLTVGGLARNQEYNSNAIKLGQAGVCEALVDVLRAWGKTNAHVAEEAYVTIILMASKSKTNKEKFMANHADQVIQASLEHVWKSSALVAVRPVPGGGCCVVS